MRKPKLVAARMQIQVVRGADRQVWLLQACEPGDRGWTTIGSFRWRAQAYLAYGLIWATERVVR